MTRPRSPHRAWIEIDHDALRHNLGMIRAVAASQAIIAVVKANAYGHGAVECARTLRAAGAERLAVATIDEAQELRGAGIDGPILLLWGVGPDEARLLHELDLEPIVTDRRGVQLLDMVAADAGRRLGVHLKVDTGLGRQGSDPDDATELALAIARSRHLALVGTFSHLAAAGEDEAHTDVQLLRLARVLDATRSAGVDPGIVHVSASAGILAGAGGFAEAVRPGLMLYGLVPPAFADADPGLRPVLTLKALALRIFDLAPGAGIGYGLRHRAAESTRVATLGIGYGDGWPRAHLNNGRALVRGQVVPMIGAISMDGLTVDCGAVQGVTYDDEFVLIGQQGNMRITADEVAAERRTINYEVTTALRGRLPRLHLGND